LTESEKEKFATLKADRSIFVEQMILASLTGPLNIDTILSTKPIEEVKISYPSDQSLDQINSEIKITKEDYCESEIKEQNQPTDSLPCDKKNVDSITKSDDEKPFSPKKHQIKCLENNLNSTRNYAEPESVQQKPLPSLMAASPNSPLFMPQAHRNRLSKGRPTSSITSGSLPPLASLAIRSSLTSRSGSIVSPTGRRKVLKHPTEPSPN